MKNDKVKFLLCLLFFVVLAAISFRCVFGADMTFAGADANIGRIEHMKQLKGDYITGFSVSTPLLGECGGKVRLHSFILQLFKSSVTFNDFIYSFYLCVASVFLMLFLRLLGRSWLSAVLASLVAFWVNSVTLAAGGHTYKLGVTALSMVALYFIELSLRSDRNLRSVGFSVFAGYFAALMVLEQEDVAILAGLFIGAYTLFRLVQSYRNEWKRWVAVLLPILSIALTLSAGKMINSYSRNVTKAASVQSEGERWDFVTQWSMVPSEWPDLIAPGWSGWSTGNTNGPYWGRAGQSAGWAESRQGFRNFRLDSMYIGIIPFLLAGAGLFIAVKTRKETNSQIVLFWGVAAVVALLLSGGKYSFLYRLFYHLPLMGNIRAPIKFVDNFQVYLGIVAAFGFDGCFRGALATLKDRVFLRRFGVVCGVLAILMGLSAAYYASKPDSVLQRFILDGWGEYVPLIVGNIARAWLHAAVLAGLLCFAIFLSLKRPSSSRWVLLAIPFVLAVDSVILTSRYFHAENIASLKRGNVVLDFLKKNQGDQRVFFLNQQGVYNQWLAVDVGYHGLNVFNYWQMPRISSEYKEFLGMVGRNQMRLWELSSVKYITAPAGIMKQVRANPSLAQVLEPVMFYRFAMDAGKNILVQPLAVPSLPSDQVLLHFKAGLPRLGLYHQVEKVPGDEQCKRLADPGFNPLQAVVVDPLVGFPELGGGASEQLTGSVSRTGAKVQTDSENDGVVLFTQTYQPQWKVFLDGKSAELIRANYLCMGVYVPAGKHEVEFRNNTQRWRFFVWSVGGIGFLLVGTGLVLRFK